MKEQHPSAKDILRRYINGLCTEEERAWVVYLGPLDEIEFTGSVSRFNDIQDVLLKISLTESIQFETQGRRAMVQH